MALVYLENMNNKTLRSEVIQKFVRSILRSIKLLLPSVQRYISSRLYFYVYAGFYSH